MASRTNRATVASTAVEPEIVHVVVVVTNKTGVHTTSALIDIRTVARRACCVTVSALGVIGSGARRCLVLVAGTQRTRIAGTVTGEPVCGKAGCAFVAVGASAGVAAGVTRSTQRLGVWLTRDGDILTRAASGAR